MHSLACDGVIRVHSDALVPQHVVILGASACTSFSELLGVCDRLARPFMLGSKSQPHQSKLTQSLPYCGVSGTEWQQ